MARGISFAEWREALAEVEWEDPAHQVLACGICGVPMPNSRPDFGWCLFDTCDACLEDLRERRKADDLCLHLLRVALRDSTMPNSVELLTISLVSRGPSC